MCECVVVTWVGFCAYFKHHRSTGISRLTTLYQNWSTIHFFAHMQAVVVQGQVRKNILGANEMLRAVNDWTEEVKVEDDALLREGCVVLGSNQGERSRAVGERPPGKLRDSTSPQHVPGEDANAIFVNGNLIRPVRNKQSRCHLASARQSQRSACLQTSETFTDRALRSVKSGDWVDAEVNCNEALELNRRCMKVKCSSS